MESRSCRPVLPSLGPGRGGSAGWGAKGSRVRLGHPWGSASASRASLSPRWGQPLPIPTEGLRGPSPGPPEDAQELAHVSEQLLEGTAGSAGAETEGEVLGGLCQGRAVVVLLLLLVPRRATEERVPGPVGPQR